jgi:hypothetical protein
VVGSIIFMSHVEWNRPAGCGLGSRNILSYHRLVLNRQTPSESETTPIQISIKLSLLPVDKIYESDQRYVYLSARVLPEWRKIRQIQALADPSR